VVHGLRDSGLETEGEFLHQTDVDDSTLVGPQVVVEVSGLALDQVWDVVLRLKTKI